MSWTTSNICIDILSDRDKVRVVAQSKLDKTNSYSYLTLRPVIPEFQRHLPRGPSPTNENFSFSQLSYHRKQRDVTVRIYTTYLETVDRTYGLISICNFVSFPFCSVLFCETRNDSNKSRTNLIYTLKGKELDKNLVP